MMNRRNRLTVILSAVVACCCIIVVTASSSTHSSSSYSISWSAFKTQHHKFYSSPHEEHTRRLIFEENVRRINQLNEEYEQDGFSMRVGVNQFADWTREEWIERKDGKRIEPLENYNSDLSSSSRPSTLSTTNTTNTSSPTSLDWRALSYVTPIKNQLSCNCDYAFASVGAIESALAIAQTTPAQQLSEQMLVDCSVEQGNNGCSNGTATAAFDFIMSSGIASEVNYPYHSSEGACEINIPTVGGTKIQAVVNVTSGDEDALLAAVVITPVVVYVNSTSEAFQFYSYGILDDPSCGPGVDHAVLVVGYGTTKKGEEYWIVKNSYGEGWGVEGYGYFARNVNQCGIATRMMYPVLL